LKFDFKTSNNQAKYETIIAGLNLAFNLEVKRLICKINSQLVVGQLKGEFKVKESLLHRYYHFVQNLIARFTEVMIQHIRREHNARADMLSHLATIKKERAPSSVIYVTLNNPSISSDECMTADVQPNWMTPIKQILIDENNGAHSEKLMRQQAARFLLIDQDLYRRGYTRPLLKCITPNQADYVMQEIHDRVCGTHSRAITMAAKILQANYYWSTVQSDCIDFVRKCVKCQEYGSLSHQRLEDLHYTLSSWPFVKWEMDIIGPFTPRKGQCKFLLVGIDYSTMWIEVKSLTAITVRNVQNFVWKSIMCRFGIPHVIITDNGQQFTD